MKLTQKTFTTKDAKGCEFVCAMQRTAYYSLTDCSLIDERIYSAMGFKASTLADLKRIISES